MCGDVPRGTFQCLMATIHISVSHYGQDTMIPTTYIDIQSSFLTLLVVHGSGFQGDCCTVEHNLLSINCLSVENKMLKKKVHIREEKKCQQDTSIIF